MKEREKIFRVWQLEKRVENDLFFFRNKKDEELFMLTEVRSEQCVQIKMGFFLAVFLCKFEMMEKLL